MSETTGPITTCGKCGRVVYAAHLDADGRCCYCPDTEPKEKPLIRKPVKDGDK